MNKDEKIKRLRDFCDQHRCSNIPDGRPKCPHKGNKFCSRYSFAGASEDAANAWYDHFFGEDQGEQTDAVNHPSHYCDGGIETIDYIRAKMSREEFIGYCKGNALKYISRAGKKVENNIKQDSSEAIAHFIAQDLSKAITYLEWARDVSKESEK